MGCSLSKRTPAGRSLFKNAVKAAHPVKFDPFFFTNLCLSSKYFLQDPIIFVPILMNVSPDDGHHESDGDGHDSGGSGEEKVPRDVDLERAVGPVLVAHGHHGAEYRERQVEDDGEDARGESSLVLLRRGPNSICLNCKSWIVKT